MHYDDTLGFTFPFKSWDIVLYILNKTLLDQYEK